MQSEGKKISPRPIEISFYGWIIFMRKLSQYGGAKIWVDELKFFFPDITNHPSSSEWVCMYERKEWTFLH